MGKSSTLFDKATQKFTPFIEFFTTERAHWIIIGVGAILRIAQFLFNRSLTEGEAPIAMNIISHSYSELFRPLDFIQPAPVGFSIIEKLFVDMFGNSEYVLRLFPFIAGIATLYLFYRIAQKFLSRNAIPIALILFVVCDHLIYFTSEVKQYSSDVAITLLLILIASIIVTKKYSSTLLVLYGCLGALTFWFSHPAVFTFFGTSIVLLMYLIQKRVWEHVMWFCIAIVIAGMSLSINYLLTLEILSTNQGLIEGFQNSFMPLPPQSFVDVQWFGYVFLRMFKNPLGFSFFELPLAVVSCIIGCIIMFIKKKKILLFLILPILCALIASGFKKYPFEGRLLLFSAPLMFLVIAEGIEVIRMIVSQKSSVVGIILVIVLLFQPVVLAGYHVIKPRAPEELRPVVKYLKNNYRKSDTIYVYYAAVKAYRYYADRFNLSQHDYVMSVESQYDWNNYYNDIKRFKGTKRLWILFSHIIKWYGVDEEKLLLSYLDIFGKRIAEFRTSGASIYLYDLGER
ncbi:hypothetical protein AMJ52_05960 [candidate division TA06 bacterium DG_78]|uniref:Glycosyltransferase RgtA/B/C/D-like domain-containing protein n=1 Tax=candidate division TA06 bacterium DG_78 TaxID=1703772 RepID=A0A0S7YCL5_UNCT6|nr:MAG: hypothetical protein AMJ52_05960 [candidate division TA06 bacterium DG_78]